MMPSVVLAHPAVQTRPRHLHRRGHTPVLCSLALSLLSFAAGSTLPAAGTPSSFRVRGEVTAPLNADSGWAAALNEAGTIQADEPFRLRFELTLDAAPANGPVRLQVRRNTDEWTLVEAHDFPHPESENAKTPRVSIVSSPAYSNGAATTDVLAGSNLPFQPGTGISLVDHAAVVAAGVSGHTELEWALVVRRFADGAVTNEAGDRFAFRLTDQAGAPLPGAAQPELTLEIRPGHVGGTFVETPGRIGPWQARNGDLYFIMEPAETSNLFMMVKSTDGGRSWREVDAAHRPPTRDLESVDSRQVGDTIHILHQVTRSTRYHAFRTSDHPTHPDTWAIGGETGATATSVAQAASLVVRPDGSIVTFYVGQTKVHGRIRSPAGQWGEEFLLDANEAPNLAGPQAVLGADGVVHLAYYGWDGTLWYRRLRTDGTLTPRELLATGAGTSRAEYGAVLPLVYLPATRTVAILYRLADGHLWERRVSGETPPTPAVRVTDRPVVRNAVDSQQPTADVIADDNTLHVLFVEQGSGSLYHTQHRSGWSGSTLLHDGIKGSWVRGNRVLRAADGRAVYAYIYDAGSEGGAGMNRFDTLPLDGATR